VAQKKAASKSKSEKVFSDEERAAMREYVQEKQVAGRRGRKGDEEKDVVAKIDAMAEPDRTMAKRLHAVIKAAAPELTSRLWYGMPAYAKNGAVVCFFQNAAKFKTRYSTFGFSDKAALDDGQMWPTSYALKELTKTDEVRIGELVKKAAG
jgi:uncharacterized protein YdhG (YjbR/CyaY superfamily)